MKYSVLRARYRSLDLLILFNINLFITRINKFWDINWLRTLSNIMVERSLIINYITFFWFANEKLLYICERKEIKVAAEKRGSWKREKKLKADEKYHLWRVALISRKRIQNWLQLIINFFISTKILDFRNQVKIIVEQNTPRKINLIKNTVQQIYVSFKYARWRIFVCICFVKLLKILIKSFAFNYWMVYTMYASHSFADISMLHEKFQFFNIQSFCCNKMQTA